MHKEVEVKLLEVNRSLMENKLTDLGAKKIFDNILKVHSFKTASVGLLRVRSEGEQTFLVVKMNEDSGFAKSSDEYSVEVSDFAATVRILELLGFKTKWQYEKHRISYQLDTVRFEFDKLLGDYDFVPEFMEIEAQSELELKNVLHLLHIPEDAVVNWTGGDVIRHYS
jgi:predicted adenylyl cyclase CyaB